MKANDTLAKKILDEILQVSLQQLAAIKERHLDLLIELVEKKKELMREYEAVEKQADPEIREYLVKLREIEEYIKRLARHYMADISTQVFFLRTALKAKNEVPASFLDENA